MPDVELLTSEELQHIHETVSTCDDPLAVAQRLVTAVDHDRIADDVDQEEVLRLAAEVTMSFGGDLEAALEYCDRAVALCSSPDLGDSGFTRAFRTWILFRLGRDAEAVAELGALRPLLIRDPNASGYITDALEFGDRAEIAEQWLTAALETVIDRYEPDDEPTPENRRNLAMVLALAQERRALRRRTGQDGDDLDELAEHFREALVSGPPDTPAVDQADPDDPMDDDQPAVLVFWPRDEYARLLALWPPIGNVIGRDWDEHRARIEQAMALVNGSIPTHVGLRRGNTADLADHLADWGEESAGLDTYREYVRVLRYTAPPVPWPPGRNGPCWCDSGAKYKKCCRSRGRA